MGVGFRAFSPRLRALMASGNHRFIRGNHDNPEVCRQERQWIADGAVEGDVMFVGGALSIDRGLRTEGLDWWADEELSIAELDRLIDVYAAAKPRIMVTHDCPQFLEAAMLEAVGSRLSIPRGPGRRSTPCSSATGRSIGCSGTGMLRCARSGTGARSRVSASSTGSRCPGLPRGAHE